ncbi:MAG: hypothetical protein JO154_22600 [Chitinophaga sp.]|uniref:hypothetical protein n=1 Tax=Chitinophaga sp. TaxID=1869181 RepID=UPI0025C4AD93|nr:hypothetical protein [Chitinophaga sp.]MBV8255408.1 hypothetical protein [Chitinophaga sp.]
MSHTSIYYLKYSTNLKDIGSVPQGQFKYYPGTDYESIDFSLDLSKVIAGIELTAQAQLTDFLNIVDCMMPRGMVFSDKAQFAIKELKLPPVQTLTTSARNMRYQGEYWVNLFDYQFYDYINYKGSKFIARGILADDIEFVSEDKIDFEEKMNDAVKKRRFEILPQLVYLKEELINNYDLFSFPKLGTALYATENFLQVYKNLGFSGLEFEQIECFKFV